MIPKNYFSSNETPFGANQGYPTEFQSGFPVGSTALPAMPPPYWGGTESSCSRRNDFKPVPQPKEFSSTYSLDALKNTWFLTTVVNGIPKRQTALANGFQLFSDTEYVDPISHLPTHHVIQLNCEEEIQIVMPAEDYDKGEYYKHFKSYIQKFPRCTKQQINNLIQYLLEGAAKYRLVLYPHPGFFRFRNGDLVFAGFPNDPRIPEQILPQSFKMRRIESVTNCPEQIIHEWARLHCSHPKLMLLGLTVIISLLLDFCEAIGVCSDFIITVRLSEKTSEEQLTALLCLQEYQLYPVPALESRAEVIRSYSASVWDAVALYRDHSFIDESKGIDGTLRILLLSTTDGDTHPIQTYKLDGTPLRLYCYDFDGSILDADVLHRLQNLESDHFWLKSTEIPECDFVPLLTDAGNRTAGQLIQEKAAENMHHFICGQSGTGKSYLMCQLMAKYLTTGHRVIAFDSSESFSYEALCSNLSKQWVDTHVDFIDIEADGIPVDLFRINHSEKLSAQKTHWVDVLKAGVGELSSQQSNALRSVISDTLGLLGKDEQLRPDDLFAMLNEDSSTYASLRNRFEPLFEDINSLGMESQSWRTFFQQNDGKIIIIRTTSACTEHGDQLIDMMLASLFSYQKENHDVPLDIFIDELQNQNFSTDSPIYQIMKEGRKDGIAFVGATQDFYPFNTELGKIMSKADTQIFLRPTLNSEGIVAAELRYRKADLARFDTMQRGDVIIKGPFYDREQGRNILTTLIGHVMPFIAAKN